MNKQSLVYTVIFTFLVSFLSLFLRLPTKQRRNRFNSI